MVRRALRLAVLWFLIFGAIVAVIVLSEASDRNVIAPAFAAGAVAALVLPRLVRWADRNE